MELRATSRPPLAADLVRTLEEAGAIADGVSQPVSTTHVLLALFTVPNPAEVLLSERSIDENSLLDSLERGTSERRGLVRTVLRHAEETAVRCDARSINTLHLLIALLKEKQSIAYRLLSACLDDVAPFRNQVMSFVTGVLPRRLMDPIKSARRLVEPSRPRAKRPLVGDPRDDWPVPRATFLNALQTTPPSANAAAAGSRLPEPSVVVYESELPSFLEEEDEGGSHISAPPDGPSAFHDDNDDILRAPLRGDSRFAPVTRAPTLLPTAYDLDPAKFPWLCTLGRNLSSLAEHGYLDPTIGRANEIEQIIDVLGKRRANNPCLVGEPGVGKTAIAEGLAVKLVSGDPDVASLQGKVIIELDMGRITAGTSLRGSFSERMQGLKKDVERAKGRVIIFIDEIHTLMGAGSSGDQPQDAANELKAALARGAFPCIGSTTLDEYKKFIEADAALERRFVRILIEEPSETETIAILKGAGPLYEEHHGVATTPEAIVAAVQLADRFVHDRQLPGKAIDLLDLTMSRARRNTIATISREDVARVCASVAKVPLDRVLLRDAERFLEMERFLGERVIGHKDAIRTISDTIRRNYAGFSTDRPMGSFLFLGPSGVGKTETAKALADFMFGSADALVRVDMSEYSEGHTVSRLVGAPPGYVGHGEGGQLTEAIRRRPHAVVLLDEIEKAHNDVLPLLLQVLDEGRLTDSKGRTVTFRHAVVVMTSNAGASVMNKKRRVGFGAGNSGIELDEDAFLSEARRAFAPELWGRVEEKCLFTPLSNDELFQIARLQLDASLATLHSRRGIEARYKRDVLTLVVDEGGNDSAVGARPMRAAIKKNVESPLADAILRGTVREGQQIRLSVREGALHIETPR